MAGYSPAINNQANLPQSTVKYYDKKFRENLKAQTPFVACSERLDLPMKSGNQYEMFMYVPLAANTATTTEGTVGTSIPVSVLNTTAVIGELSKCIAHRFQKLDYIRQRLYNSRDGGKTRDDDT